MPGIDGIETLRRLKASETCKCKDAPVIALTANVFSGVRDMYLSEGFDDYLGKPINGKQLEEMLRIHLPKEKLMEAEPKTEPVLEEKQKEDKTEETALDITKGLGYCANSPDIYCDMLSMFCKLREPSEEELARYLAAGDWKNYTIKVHALKTNARSIGASAMGELCYELELTGKKIQAGEEAEEQKALITEKHPEMLSMFDRAVTEAKEYMRTI